MSEFDASGSIIGYLYQLRYALHLALGHRLPDALVYIETVDDILFESHHDPAQVIQTKHHSSPGNLTDSSPDLWKTLRIWASHSKSEPGEHDYVLVTTARSQPGSIASLLTADRSARAPKKAQEKLDAIARSSSSISIKPAIDEWNSLSTSQKQRLLKRTSIADSSPSMKKLDYLLKDQVALLSGRDRMDDLLSAIEGRWFRLCIRQLERRSAREPISADEIQEFARETARAYRRETLPLHFGGIVPGNVEAEHGGRLFVKQAQWVESGSSAMRRAIHDFYRAFNQRSKWLREGHVYPLDLEEYDALLRDEWERCFDRQTRDISAEADSSAKVAAGRAIFDWVHEEAAIHLRQDCTAPWICRGSFQMMADEKPPELGWHPDFRTLSTNGGDIE